jgi:hypothetical protein
MGAMALPPDDTQWPPIELTAYARQQERWAAWYSGSMTHLKQVAEFDMGQQGGRRSFWQRRAVDDATQATPVLHAPLAGEMALTSADLLFGEAPDLQVLDESGDAGDVMTSAAQERLEELIVKNSLLSKLVQGADLAAGIGGVYLRPVWDMAVCDFPMTTIVSGENALPEFRFDQLFAVTFAEPVVYEQDGSIWWHVERHEKGTIEHGLYHGTKDNLGTRMRIDAIPQTAGLPDAVLLPSPLDLELLVDYVPNALPNRSLRHKPLGRSDYAGAETFLDALDEVWSSLMRDVRLGQSRVMVDSSMTTTGGIGGARRVDLDRDLFVEIEMSDAAKKFEVITFALRVADHVAAIMQLTEKIVSNGGYSPQTFGLQIQGQAESGTALRMRENKTFRTQGRKQGLWQGPVEHHAQMLLAIDATIFGRPTPVMPVQLTWPELQDDPMSRATWIKTLGDAAAASVRTRVKLAQPELTGDELDKEVEAVMKEAGIGVPQPGLIGFGEPPAPGAPADPNAPPVEPVPVGSEVG